MEKGDVIIHSFGKEKKYQWVYCIKGNDKSETDTFEAGKFEAIILQRFFNTREEAITDVNKYAEENHLKKSNIIN
jgi:hypothetical protein